MLRLHLETEIDPATGEERLVVVSPLSQLAAASSLAQSLEALFAAGNDGQPESVETL